MYEYIKQHIRDIKDFPKPGITFKDITPALGDSKCFNDIRQGQQLSEANIQRIYEQMEHYEKLGGNSYIHKEFEDLKRGGLL